jgi:hypothetical protein
MPTATNKHLRRPHLGRWYLGEQPHMAASLTPSPAKPQAPSETVPEQAESPLGSHKSRYVNSQDAGKC